MDYACAVARTVSYPAMCGNRSPWITLVLIVDMFTAFSYYAVNRVGVRIYALYFRIISRQAQEQLCWSASIKRHPP